MNLLIHFEHIKKTRINERILAQRVLLVLEGKNPEEMTKEAALRIADDMGLDLVEVNPNPKAPICKIMDYGKYLYKKRKQEQDAKKNQKQTEMKTIRLGFRTEEHDLSIKETKARTFLEKGNLVKFHMVGRGRELAYKHMALEKLEKFIANLSDVATVDQPPKTQGNNIYAIVKPIK